MRQESNGKSGNVPPSDPPRGGRLKQWARVITSPRFAIAVVVIPVLFYVYRQIHRDAVIIDPFAVPGRFADAGLSGQVMAERVGDQLHRIELLSRTRMRTDNPVASQDDLAIPDIEIPGTKLGLKTFVDVTRAVFGMYPTRVTGDIVLPLNSTTSSPPMDATVTVTVTIYVTRGQQRIPAQRVELPNADADQVVQAAAKLVLQAINPYVYASYLDRHGKVSEAAALAERMILNPSASAVERKAAYNLLGSIRTGQHQYDEAVRWFTKAIAIDGHFAMAFSNWGNVLERQHQHDAAIGKYQQASEVDPHFASGYDAWGILLANQKRYEEAIAKYQEALKRDRLDVVAYDRWGETLLAENKLDEAAEKFKTALSIDPFDVTAYIQWASLLVKQKRNAEADAKYNSAMNLDPSNASTYLVVADVLHSQLRCDQAIPIYRKAIAADPEYVAAYNNLGIVFFEVKRYSDAINMFKKELDLVPTYALAYDNWGEVLREQNQVEEATAMYRKAIELEPTLAEAYDGLGRALLKRGNTAEGNAMLEKSKQLGFTDRGPSARCGEG
jgi:tetratricopeptide (TPR) repeat protein